MDHCSWPRGAGWHMFLQFALLTPFDPSGAECQTSAVHPKQLLSLFEVLVVWVARYLHVLVVPHLGESLSLFPSLPSPASALPQFHACCLFSQQLCSNARVLRDSLSDGVHVQSCSTTESISLF